MVAETIWFYIMQICSLLRTIFHSIQVIPLTKQEAMKISPKMHERSYNPKKKTTSNGNSLPLIFAPVSNIIINITEYANAIKFSMTSINLSHDILLVQ